MLVSFVLTSFWKLTTFWWRIFSRFSTITISWLNWSSLCLSEPVTELSGKYEKHGTGKSGNAWVVALVTQVYCKQWYRRELDISVLGTYFIWYLASWIAKNKYVAQFHLAVEKPAARQEWQGHTHTHTGDTTGTLNFDFWNAWLFKEAFGMIV